MAYRYENCKTGAKYCSFRVLRSEPDVQIESCRFCHRFVRYNIKEGKMDNERYRLDHIRDFCQPFGRTAVVYEFVYGREKIEELRKLAEEPAQRQRNQDALSAEFKAYMKGGDKKLFFTS